MACHRAASCTNRRPQLFQKKVTSMTRRQYKQKVLFDLFHFFNQSQHHNVCLFCFLSPETHNALLHLIPSVLMQVCPALVPQMSNIRVQFEVDRHHCFFKLTRFCLFGSPPTHELSENPNWTKRFKKTNKGSFKEDQTTLVMGYECLCSWVRLCTKIWYQYGTGTNPS